jgi:hypothetical protein
MPPQRKTLKRLQRDVAELNDAMKLFPPADGSLEVGTTAKSPFIRRGGSSSEYEVYEYREERPSLLDRGDFDVVQSFLSGFGEGIYRAKAGDVGVLLEAQQSLPLVANQDGFYIIQGLYEGEAGYLAAGGWSTDDEAEAIEGARRLLRAPDFEGDSVRVITRDGELVFEGPDPT